MRGAYFPILDSLLKDEETIDSMGWALSIAYSVYLGFIAEDQGNS